jgi:hypothetical protein
VNDAVNHEDSVRRTGEDAPHCSECNGALRIELWILDTRDVALLHVCAHHGAAAISLPLR